MLRTVVVEDKHILNTEITKGVVISYRSDDGRALSAPVGEGIDCNIGDTVKVFSDYNLSYKGYTSVVVEKVNGR